MSRFGRLKIALSKLRIGGGAHNTMMAVHGGKGLAVGAALGGGANAARQHFKNKKNPDKKKSLIGAALKGGAVGGTVGAGVGAVKGTDKYIDAKARANVFKQPHLDPDRVWDRAWNRK